MTKPTDAELKTRLTPEQYQITQNAGTERAFTGCFWDHKGDGRYHCICCDAVLFDSRDKYDSGSGWPSYTQPAEGHKAAVEERADNSLGMRRVEAVCSACHAHLGHVFDDGPAPTGQRYCINSASLRFVPRDST